MTDEQFRLMIEHAAQQDKKALEDAVDSIRDVLKNGRLSFPKLCEQVPSETHVVMYALNFLDTQNLITSVKENTIWYYFLPEQN